MRSLEKDMPTLKWIFRVMGSDRKWIYVLILLRALQGLEGILSILVVRDALTAVLLGSWDGFLWMALWFLALTLIGVGVQILADYWAEKGTIRLEKRFRERLFRELMRRSYIQVSAKHSGEWLIRICSDARILSESLLIFISQLFGVVVQLVGALCALFFMLPEATVLMILGSGLLILISVLFRGRLKSLNKCVQAADGAVWSFMQERLSGLMIVRAFTQEKNVTDQAVHQMDKWVQARLLRNKWATVYGLFIHGVRRGGYFIIIALCGIQLLWERIGYDTLVAVLLLARQIETLLINLTILTPKYFAMLASADRMMEIEVYPLDCMGESHEQETIRSYYAQQFSALGIHHGSFAYDGDGKQTVLSDYELEIRKNQFVAFLGASGCGKSTVLKLLLGLYPLQEGEAYLRDTDGNEHTLDAIWRGLFAYVPQGNQLLSGTIREAVTFGVQDLMKKERDIWDALRVARADDFVSELPDGLDNGLGERGTGLSEGQMQRIAIARAIFSGRPILLLDEATSALDSETERQLLCNLRTMTDRTVILVTHRPAAAEICDVKIEFPSQ